MPKEENIFRDSKVKYRGIFDVSLLYKKLREWYMREGYDDPKEIKYVEKIKPEGKQIEIAWETDKIEEAGYFKLVQEIKFYVTRLSEIDVERDGQKIKLDKCDIELAFSSKVVANADEKWKEYSFMFKMYERYIIKYRLEELKIDVYKDTSKIMEEVKNFLNLYKF